MSLQTCVERLFTLNSNYLHAEQAFNQASSLQTLSDDLYTDPFRFVYELVQNADDARSTNLQLTLIENDYLIVAHNGKVFDEKDVRSLCAVSNSTKTRDSRAAGYKGLGFKAVFGKSDFVLIMTNGESFRFDGKHKFQWTWDGIDQATWEVDNERKFIYPWQICPIWTKTQQIPKSIQTWLSKEENQMPVNIIIRLRNTIETRNALEELSRQPHTFLFLRHIRQVEFLGKMNVSKILIEQKSDGSTKLSYAGNQRSQWLLSRQEIKVPGEVLHDIRLPEKLRGVQSTEIGLAANIDVTNGKTFVPVSNNDSVLFAYMPTKISTYNLPLLVNANFLTNANREQIHTDSIWNQWLFECIPSITIDWLKELIKDRTWQNTAYDLLPKPTRGKDTLAKTYDKSCSDALTNIKFIRNTLGEYLTLNEAVIDMTFLSNQPFIGTEPIRQFILDSYKLCSRSLSCHPFILDNSRLRELGVQIFNWENAIDMFKSEEFQKKFSIDRNISLISYLFDVRADAEISKLLRRIPFIMDRHNRLQPTANIYLPSEFNDETWYTSDCPEAYVHTNVKTKLQANHIGWLQQLGVTVKTDLTFFHRAILPNARTIITNDNAISTVQRLFYLFTNGQITSDDLRKLGELSLLTRANTLVPAHRLYLSSAYQPYLSLDNLLPRMAHRFVSPSYMQDVFRIEWKFFFLILGVQENIERTQLTNDYRFIINYYDDQRRIIFNLGSRPVDRYKYQMSIRFLELTEDNFEFACFFWGHVLKTIDVQHLNQPEIAYWGASHLTGAREGSVISNFPEWFVQTRPCIPIRISLADGTHQQECRTGPKVFTNKLISSIGHYLPVFECPPDVQPLNDQWLKFFRFKTELSIDDHFFVLHQIYVRNQTTTDPDDEMRIQNIYTSLLKILSNSNERQSYREKCQSTNLCLLSERDHLFMPPEELNSWSIDTIKSPSELHILKLNSSNHRDKNVSDLLYILNVNQIQMSDLKLIPINDAPCDELTKRLQKTSLIRLIDFLNFKEANINQLDHILFLEADRLELYVNNPSIFVGTAQVHVTNNYFYTTKPWNSNLVLEQLSIRICELLNLPILSFKTHIYTLLTTSSVEEYFIQLGILPADNLDSSNDQFAKLIERNNLELFNQLQHLSPSHTPAELLIAGLEAQTSVWTGYVYHYTHLENAASILRDQVMKSRHLCQANSFKDSSSYDFMSHSDEQVNHYVRFYFRPLTFSQSHNENLGTGESKKRNKHMPICPVPIFFRINLKAILNIPNIQWKVSLNDMSKDQAEYNSTLDVIQRFDFCGVFSEFNEPRGQRSAQLEFLIENQLDLGLLLKENITLIYQNSDAKQSLECMLQEQLYQSMTNKDYFFGTNDRIFINHDSEQDHISVMIDGRQTQRIGGMFIIQIKLDKQEEKIDVACRGDISATFHYDHITTIYGKESKLDVFVRNRAYAVYYMYEQQTWLIYTNHGSPDFDSSHIQQHPEFIPYH